MPRALRPPLCIVTFLLALGILPAAAQEMASYYDQYEELAAPPSVFQEGLMGAANPALPSVGEGAFMGLWGTQPGDLTSVRSWGLFSSFRFGSIGVAPSLRRRNQGGLTVTSLGTSVSGGGPRGAVGIGYQRFWGDAAALGRYNRFQAGMVWRPSPHLSLGFIGHASLETDDREGIATLGVRPFGSSRLTLFGDAALAEGQAVENASWSVGAATEPVDGVSLVGRYFKSDGVSIGLSLDFGRLGVRSQTRRAEDGSPRGTTHRVRFGSPVPSVLAGGAEADDHLALRLDGGVPYRRFPFQRLLGEGKPRFYEVIRSLRQAAESERIQTVALNLADLQIGPEKAWELRSLLQSVQEEGKTVVVYFEGGGMTTYHLASVADRVVLDPEGTLQLPGYVLNRTYLKGTLDTLGLGFQSWRFFEYKSAQEYLSRTSMSRADSLQNQAYVDDQYALMRENVSASRPIDPDSLDALIDTRVFWTAREAQKAALVDTLARWTEVEAFLKSVTGRDTDGVSPDELDALATASRAWGAPPEIALVYGLGATATGSGLKARELSERLRELKDDDQVAAVVFRVDSPGGPHLAADLVAEAVKACAEEKPVIVSQGQVAASGGYLISAHADTILAGPNTVTGSIGVIGGWLYDNGFSTKTGLSSDAVSRGKRAELLGEHISIPGVVPGIGGAQIPAHKLSDDELARVESVIRQLYDRFVGAVATGRDTTEAHVRSVAEGRVWSGEDGRQNGLVDQIGGLATALSIARTEAGLTGQRVRVREANPIRELGLSTALSGPGSR